MFESALETALKKIFDLPEVRFSQPDSSKEQNILFVDVVKAVPTHKPKVAKCRVSGTLTLFAPYRKLPFGFFQKKLQSAQSTDTSPFYFYNMEENDKVSGETVERRISFVYFFSTQFDPEQGSLTSVEF